jgi:hypothetical protein
MAHGRGPMAAGWHMAGRQTARTQGGARQPQESAPKGPRTTDLQPADCRPQAADPVPVGRLAAVLAPELSFLSSRVRFNLL